MMVATLDTLVPAQLVTVLGGKRFDGGDDAKPPADGGAGGEDPAKGAADPAKGGAGGADPKKEEAKARSAEDYDREIKELRSEAASRRQSEKELKEKLKVFEDEKAASEKKRLEEEGKYKEIADSAEKKLAEKQAKFAQRTIMQEIKMEAQSLGALDASIAELIPRDKITYDEETGEVTGVKEAVEAFKAAKPSLFKEPGQQTKNTGPAKKDPPPANGNLTTVANLSEAEYQKELQKALSGK